MSCDQCIKAANENPRLNAFSNGCMSCDARALAVTGAHLESAQAGSMTAHYRSVLEKVFGESWREGHALVRTWVGVMNKRGK